MATLHLDHRSYNYDVPGVLLGRNLRYAAGEDLPLDSVAMMSWAELSRYSAIRDLLHGDWLDSDQARDFWVTLRALILEGHAMLRGSLVIRIS